MKGKKLRVTTTTDKWVEKLRQLIYESLGEKLTKDTVIFFACVFTERWLEDKLKILQKLDSEFENLRYRKKKTKSDYLQLMNTMEEKLIKKGT